MVAWTCDASVGSKIQQISCGWIASKAVKVCAAYAIEVEALAGDASWIVST
jgi:hypothetical protein